MGFEYDPRKSTANKQKHGIDFEEAKVLWDDIYRLEVPAVIRGNESRYAVIGRIEARVWTAIVAYRSDNIRIISVYPSSRKQRRAYEEI